MKTYRVKSLVAATLAAPMMLAATPARADTATGLLLFYGAIRLSEAEAIRAGANYYEAIGMAAEAQQYTRLANDFQSGTMGGDASVKTFVQCSDKMVADIGQLQAAGVYPNARQKELAKKARGQLAVAKVALVAAVAVGTKTVVSSEGNMFVKIAMGALVGAEAAKVIGALNRVNQAASAYKSYQLGGANGFQVASKEALPQFADL